MNYVYCINNFVANNSVSPYPIRTKDIWTRKEDTFRLLKNSTRQQSDKWNYFLTGYEICHGLVVVWRTANTFSTIQHVTLEVEKTCCSSS